MKAFDVVFLNDKDEKTTTLCIGAETIAQAARKAEAAEEKYGEAIKLELTDRVIL